MIGRNLSMTETAPLYRNRQPRWRKARRQALKAQGITPANRMQAWCVEIAYKELHANLRQWLDDHAIRGLGSLTTRVWLRPRDGRALLKKFTNTLRHLQVTRTEYYHCDLCYRPMIADEAEKRRALINASPQGRLQPCGPNCKQDSELNTWRRLARAPRRIGGAH